MKWMPGKTAPSAARTKVPAQVLLKHLVLKPLWRQNLDPVLGTETWVETSVEDQTLCAGRLVRQTKHINRFSLEEGV